MTVGISDMWPGGGVHRMGVTRQWRRTRETSCSCLMPTMPALMARIPLSWQVNPSSLPPVLFFLHEAEQIAGTIRSS